MMSGYWDYWDNDKDFRKDTQMMRYSAVSDIVESFILESQPQKVKPTIVKVIFHEPATIVYWSDGDKTVVKCSEKDTFNPETGLAMAILKKEHGDDYYKTLIKKWIKTENPPQETASKSTAENEAYQKFREAWAGINNAAERFYDIFEKFQKDYHAE